MNESDIISNNNKMFNEMNNKVKEYFSSQKDENSNILKPTYSKDEDKESFNYNEKPIREYDSLVNNENEELKLIYI